MYTFYTDKQELFECKLDLEGAKLSDSKARLVLESDNYNLLFYGSIDENGTCKIPVKRLKNLLQETDTGKVKLEVIAEDTFFEPWNDSYNVKTNKKVTVEVVSKQQPQIQEKKVAVVVNEVKNEDSRINNITEVFLQIAGKKNITAKNINENIKTVNKICDIISAKYKLKEQEVKALAESIIKKLK